MAEKAPCRWVNITLDAFRPQCRPERFMVPDRRRKFCNWCLGRIEFVYDEPEPAKDTPGCQWEQDWEGNWEASCSLCWAGDDIGGMNFCPNCGLPVAAVPYTEPPDTQRTDPPNCEWHRDEFGNWFSGCSETMPDFTPWKGTDPKGSFCPKCGKIITVRVHDKP